MQFYRGKKLALVILVFGDRALFVARRVLSARLDHFPHVQLPRDLSRIQERPVT